MKKRSKRVIAIAMTMVTLGSVALGVNNSNKIKSHADESDLNYLTIGKCSRVLSAANYLTKGFDWFNGGSTVNNNGVITTPIKTKPNLIFANDGTEKATDNWRVNFIQETYSDVKTVKDSQFANYLKSYANTMYGEAYMGASSKESEIQALASADYESCLALAKVSNKVNNVHTYYSTTRATLVTGSVQLDDNSNGKSNLTKGFINDAFATLDENSGFTFEDLIERYGTHYVQNVQVGGRVQINYSLSSNNAEESETLVNAVSTALNAELTVEDEDDAQNSQNPLNPLNPLNPQKPQEKDEPRVRGIVDFLLGRAKGDVMEATYGSVTVVRETKTIGPVFNGNLNEWYKAVEANPQCLGTSEGGIPIVTLIDYMTPENTGRTEEEIAELRRFLNVEYNQYAFAIKEEQAKKLSELDNKSDVIPNSGMTTEVIEPAQGPVAIREKEDFRDGAALEEIYQNLHKGFSMGELKVFNKLAKNPDTGCYNYSNLGKMRIEYKLNQHLGDLPVGESGAESHKMDASSSNLSHIFGKKLLGIRNGAFYVEIEYNDGSNEILNQNTNIFKDLKQGQTIDICSFGPSIVNSAIAKGGINKIDVVILYNTKANYANKKDNSSQDWKTVYTIYF